MVIIGGGPVGIRAAQELSRRGIQVLVLSAESVLPYNRVQLTPLLCGDVQFGRISLIDADDRDLPFDVQLGQRVVRIDRDARTVMTADGGVWPYDTLILATGSHAFVPGIPGKDKPGVYTFRTADDASALIARSFSARRVAVIGGGLLGLEAARGMRQRSCDVTVAEHESHLMPRQLDKAGGARLAANIEALGVNVITGCAVKEITGTHRVEGLALADGRHVTCDTVIICTGVRPNIALARDNGLAFHRGIVVGDQMQTSDPSIYAIGECAEHRDLLYGLVGPGYAQAEVAAATIAGTPDRFDEVAPTTKLKVIGADVFSAGAIEQLEVGLNVRSHVWQEGTAYRRIFVERGKLVGALAVGKWDQASRAQDAVHEGATVYPWMLYRFRKTGLLWTEEDIPAADMPAHATLCNCTGVTCGQVRKAIGAGCGSVEAIGETTGAGTVCGTCRPLMAEVIDAGAGPQPQPLWKPVLGLSAVALLAAIWPLLGGNVPLPTSYDADSLRVWLWQDNIVKQWSGFILLGLTVAALVIGLRKRVRLLDRLGSFDAWRLVHLGIGVATIAALFAHTGFSLGSGWNFALGATFSAMALTGALAGVATGGEHELRAHGIGTSRKPPRKLPVWAHILLLWPLPALIAFHVLASYAF
ncbi:FAD-dependent oxidoreductase [Tropicimonas sp. S265A]|uniref:FAD-dependent oxidoreductase n=1 Tax=Tropicimonas sp. S265A TaxID=3415134 RepID=UPI003C7EC661